LKRHVILTALVALTLSAQADEWSDLPIDFPSEVRAFILRRLTCEHWAQEGLNPANYSQSDIHRLEQEIAALKCDAVEVDEAALRKKYSSSAAVIHALTDSINWDPPQP